MNTISTFLESHRFTISIILIVLGVLLLAQILLWLWRTLSRRRYASWLVGNSLLRDWCAGDYAHPLLRLSFGDSLRAIDFLVKEQDPSAEDILIEALSSKIGTVRDAASTGLGKIGSLKAVPFLVKEQRDEWYHAMASRALIQIHGQSPDPRPVIDSIVGALDGSDQDRKSVSLLVELKRFDELLSIVPRLNPSAAVPAVDALGKSGDPRAPGVLMSLDTRNSKELKRAIITALKELRSAESIPYLTGLLKDDLETRIGAAQALGALGDPRALEPLLELLGDAEPKVREAAANALGGFKDPVTVEPLIRAMLYDRVNLSCYVRVLGEIGDIRAIPPLIGLLLYGGDRSGEIVECLKKFGPPAGTEALLIALRFHRHNPSLSSRIAAALIGLRASGETSEKEEIQKLLARPDSAPLRKEDFEALLRWIRQGGELEAEYIPPVYGEEPDYGVYGEYLGTFSVLQEPARITLKVP